MRGRRTASLSAIALMLGALAAAPAQAFGPVGGNPPANIPMGAVPQACWRAPRGATCVAAGVKYLNRARATMGQGPYALPRGFASLSQAKQAFVLTNLDRTHYGLAPVKGLTKALNRDAAAGVRREDDPLPKGRGWDGFTSNWAAGYPNMVFAYGGWMYDDGPGSGNLECTARKHSGCWGHRHDILWRFGSGGPLAMGAAAGTAGGMSGFAMLLEQERRGIHLAYTYRWHQAVMAGATRAHSRR